MIASLYNFVMFSLKLRDSRISDAFGHMLQCEDRSALQVIIVSEGIVNDLLTLLQNTQVRDLSDVCRHCLCFDKLVVWSIYYVRSHCVKYQL